MIAQRQGHRPPIAVDNTLLGPMYQQPLRHGADLSIYSLTKYAGGHSDLVAGGVSGRDELRAPDRPAARRPRAPSSTRTPAGCCCARWRRWGSAPTAPTRTAAASPNICAAHPRIAAVHYLGFLAPPTTRARPCSPASAPRPGSTFSFDIEGGEAEAFAFLDRLQIMKLAVSLGGTETLISHPASTTHSGVPRDLREEIGLTDALIRISVGIEHPDDLIADLEQALA